MLFVECFKSCNCSLFFYLFFLSRVGVWIPTGGQRGFNQMAKAFKKGLFFSCYFLCIFLPVKSKSFWEEELYWVQAIGVWVVRKRWGILDLGLVGGQNIARTKCGMVVGLGLFFFSFSFFFFRFFSFSLLQSRLRWGLPGLSLNHLDTAILFSAFPHQTGLSRRSTKQKKKTLVSKERARCNW